MENVKTERGGEVYTHEGMDYTERKDRRGADGSRTWRCRDYHKHKCSATIRTLDGQVIEEKSRKEHNHAGDPLLSKVREVQSQIHKRASTTMDSTRSVVASKIIINFHYLFE